jgi:hypothetical protein
MDELMEYKKLLESLIHPEKPHRAVLTDEMRIAIAKALSKHSFQE